MGDASFQQANFLGGEWSPEYQGRTDNPRYKTAMNVSLNGYPVEEGAWKKRSGFKTLFPTLDGNPAKIIPFNLSPSQAFDVELSDGFLRIYTQDRLVCDSTDSIVSISGATPAILTTTNTGATSWTTGQQAVIIPGAGGNFSDYGNLPNMTMQLTVASAGIFSLHEAVTVNAVDGSQASGVASGSGLIARTLIVATPYTGTEWKDVNYCMVGNTMYLFHPNHFPQALVLTNYSGFLSTFTFGPATIDNGPYFDAVDGQIITVSGTSGSIAVTLTGGFGPNQSAATAGDIGRVIALFNEPDAWNGGTAYTASQPVKDGGFYYYAVGSPTVGIHPTNNPAQWIPDTNLAAWAWGVISGFSSGTSITVTLEVDLLYNNSINTWKLGLFGDPNRVGPTYGAFHEGRVWMGYNRTLVTTTVGEFPLANTVSTLVFDPTLINGTVTDANAINYTLESGDDDRSEIYWLAPDIAGIIVGTAGGEWLVRASALDDPITPTSIQARRVTKYRAAPIRPVRTPLSLVFVQLFKRKIQELLPDVFTGKYVAPNLTATAKHLTQGGVQEIMYQEEVTPIIWSRDCAGKLLGITYRRQSAFPSEEPIYTGWHKHQHGDPGRAFTSLSMSPTGISGGVDSLHVVTATGASQSYQVERMIRQFEVSDNMNTGFLVDGVVPCSALDQTTSIKLFGMYNLVGRIVDVVIAGIYVGQFVVDVQGGVTVPYTATFTAAYVVSQQAQNSMTNGVQLAASGGPYTISASVGFAYQARGQILRPGLQADSGAQNGPPLGKVRRLHMFGALLSGTQSISFGSTFTKMHAAAFKSGGGTPFTSSQLFSGVYWDTVEDEYSFDSMLAWQTSGPYPATVVSVSGFLHTQDR